MFGELGEGPGTEERDRGAGENEDAESGVRAMRMAPDKAQRDEGEVPEAAKMTARIGTRLDLDAALARLNEVAGELREEVAAEVSRRRVPELVFRIAPPSDV